MSDNRAQESRAAALERDGMAWPPMAGEPIDLELAGGLQASPSHAAGTWPGPIGSARDFGAIGALVRDVSQTLVLAAALTLALQFVVQAREVLGSSMVPTLHTGQRVLVNRLSYGPFGEPQRGHIVVFESWGDDTDYIKRIVGVPGDTIELRGGDVLVNGVALDEPYLSLLGHDAAAPITLGPDEYYVLGDNRPNSADSRYYGPLPADRIIGRAWLSLWPPDDVGTLGD